MESRVGASMPELSCSPSQNSKRKETLPPRRKWKTLQRIECSGELEFDNFSVPWQGVIWLCSLRKFKCLRHCWLEGAGGVCTLGIDWYIKNRTKPKMLPLPKQMRKISANQQICSPSKCDSQPLIAYEWRVIYFTVTEEAVVLNQWQSKTQQYLVSNKFILYIVCWGAEMAQWSEHSPPTNVAPVRFPDPAP